jgi:Phage integrase family
MARQAIRSRERVGGRSGSPCRWCSLLREHKEQQGRDREHARQLWRESGYVLTSPTGQPLKPNSDHHRWKALLKSAGVRDARLHDARHTAATVLLVLGVPERTVMGIMGWSSTSMAARYQHVTDPIRHAVAAQVGDENCDDALIKVPTVIRPACHGTGSGGRRLYRTCMTRFHASSQVIEPG